MLPERVTLAGVKDSFGGVRSRHRRQDRTGGSRYPSLVESGHFFFWRRGEQLMSTITKKELIDRIADGTGTKRVLVKRIVQSFLDEIIEEEQD